MSRSRPPDEQLMTSGEVAKLFRVDPKTVTRWGRTGKLPSVRTPGGQFRYPVRGVRAALESPAGPR